MTKKSTKGLAEKKKVIRVFFAITMNKTCNTLLRGISKIEQADLIIDALNHPERYPEELYPTWMSIANNTPVRIIPALKEIS